MRIGVIDMGTNTFNFLIVEQSNADDFTILKTEKYAVRLGEQSLYKNVIGHDAMMRAVGAIKKIKVLADKYNVSQINAFATSAVRSATNKHEFITFLKAKTGLEINVISGEEEATLIYYGVQKAVKGINNASYLIMDIGGGSTEFIIVQDNEIVWKHSFQLGVTRLLQYFSPSDPITKAEVVKIESYLTEKLQPLTMALKKYKIKTLVGSSGSFDTIVSLIVNQLHNPIGWRPSTSYTVAIEDYILVHRLLVLSTLEERKHMKGMDPMRIEMMVLATIFIKFVIKKFNIEQLIQSSYALKEGAVIKLLKTITHG